MFVINITHEALSPEYPNWVQRAMKDTMLRNLNDVIGELDEENKFHDIWYEISAYLIDDIPNELLPVYNMSSMIKSKPIFRIKVFYRDILIREYKNEDTEIKYFFENDKTILGDFSYRKSVIDEALKQIITGKGKCPSPLTQWWSSLDIQRVPNIVAGGGVPIGNISFSTARRDVGKTIFFDTESSLDLKSIRGVNGK